MSDVIIRCPLSIQYDQAAFVLEKDLWSNPFSLGGQNFQIEG